MTEQSGDYGDESSSSHPAAIRGFWLMWVLPSEVPVGDSRET